MALLHYLHLIYELTLTSTSTPSNKLKLITAIIALLTFKYRSHAIGTRRRDDLKEPKGAVPFLGHMPLMASIPGTRLHDTFLKNYRELGPVWSISLPGIGRMIHGDSPELVEHVSKTNFEAYEKGEHFNEALGDIFGKGQSKKTQRNSKMLCCLCVCVCVCVVILHAHGIFCCMIFRSMHYSLSLFDQDTVVGTLTPNSHFLLSYHDPFTSLPIGIISTDGEDWKSKRKQATQVFNIKVFREYSSEMFSKESQKVVDYLDKAATSGAVVDFHELMHAFALDSFGR
jgi:hypothetical protein